LSFYFHGHQKELHLGQKSAIQWGATYVWIGSSPKLSPSLDPPLNKEYPK